MVTGAVLAHLPGELAYSREERAYFIAQAEVRGLVVKWKNDTRWMVERP